MESAEDLRIGDRFQDADGNFGVIRYIGHICTSKDPSSIYYGVEWDNYGRGLHDGSIVDPQTNERVQYFCGAPSRTCSSTHLTEHKCSFLKLEKLRKDGACRRNNFVQVFLERYNSLKNPDSVKAGAKKEDIVVIEHIETGKEGITKPIELVGSEKLRNKQTLHALEHANVSNARIGNLGGPPDSQFRDLISELQELDLSCNLLRSYTDIEEIIAQVPQLKILNLSGNRFIISENFPSTRVYHSVRVLALNKTMLSWSDIVERIIPSFPELEELYFSDNDVTDQDLGKAKDTVIRLHRLRVLDLQNNRLCSWLTLTKAIGSLPSLTHLILNQNQITDLNVPLQAQKFQSLQNLSIADNRLDSWRSIDILNQFPSLVSLRYLRNPLCEDLSSVETRSLIIARVRNLKTYSGNQINDKERKDAERMYLSRMYQELLAIRSKGKDVEQSEAELASLHPRFAELKEAYPDAASPSSVKSGETLLAKSLLELKFVPISMLSTVLDPFVKKLPENMTMSQLKLFIYKQVGVPVAQQRLTYRADSRSMPTPMDDDDDTAIGFYGLESGMQILINDNEI